VDPLASLRPAPIEFDLGEWIYEVPAMWAVDWLIALEPRQPARVVPGLLHAEDRLRVMRDMLARRITPEDIVEAGRAVVEAAGGWRWWSVQRLVDSALHGGDWPALHGSLLLEGVDLERTTLAGFCNIIFTVGLRGCEKQSDRDKLRWEVEKPPPGFADQVELTDEAEFMAMLGSQQRITGAASEE
jgi:hypothetical protein